MYFAGFDNRKNLIPSIAAFGSRVGPMPSHAAKCGTIRGATPGDRRRLRG
jgi:hypothetical protein